MKVSDIRRYHANAIFHRIRVEPQTSQRDIVRKTGFDKSTVSSIVNRFDELGLILRSARTAGNRPGRPTEGLSISPDAGLLVGVQVEAGEIAIVAAGLDGAPLAHLRQFFDGAAGKLEERVAEGIEAVIGNNLRSMPLLGVGVSLPGLVRHDGSLVHAPILGWHDIPVLERLQRTVSVPIYVGNDGKAAAMAERMFGSCVDIDDFVYMFSGSGVGGALFLGGSIYLGAEGLAGELGHIKVVPHGRLCSCGGAGCLSAYLSESAIATHASVVSGRPIHAIEEILALAQEGDPAVLDAFSLAGEVLGTALSNLVNTFNPPVVVLGGDMARAEAYLRPSLEPSLKRQAHPSIYARSQVIFSEISAAKPYLGGIALALDGVTGLESSSVLP
ncbi:ROK family transcriptional regulator [Labrys sp. WJW]|uniref:ROK family transcriptional regulator n=1 Tax=Labrys sp. WJW TaxID=1737983 RepID=UPI0009ED47DF|nr:ROK family transcriptional regulator [Labrys sp. WJW]